MAGRSGIEALAFRGPGIEETDESQTVLHNLATVREEWWRPRQGFG